MKKELTPFSIFLGITVGVVMTVANVYLGLYAGMTVSASIPAAVISMAILSSLGIRSIGENNIVQTMASAGESLAAGIIFTLPALVLVGAWSDFKFWETTMIAICGGLLGVLFMIPLRKALIEEDKDLIYPEGVACASVLQAGADGAQGGLKTILIGLGLGGVFKFLVSGLKVFVGSYELAKKAGSSVFFFGLDISPALLAVGYIINLNVALLVFIGGAIGWFIAIPMMGTPDQYSSVSEALDLAWTLWSKEVRYVGVGAMIVGGLASIISVRKGVSSGISSLIENMSSKNSKGASKDLSLSMISIVFSLTLILMFYIYFQMIQSLGLTVMTVFVMTLASFIFVAVSSYIVGLVGSSNNPVSGMTISALLGTAGLFLALGATGDSAILTTLGVAAVVCCAACTAGDCSQDLKTGSLVGATPKAQQIAQIIGVLIPAFTIAPTLSFLHQAYGIGEGLKAPQATLFASITNALFGSGSLPYGMVILGAVIGVIILIVDHLFLKGKSKFRLHLMPLAVGIYLPVTLAVPMLVGAIIRTVVDKKRTVKSEGEDQGILMSSGLIAGEALMGVFVAIILLLEDKNGSKFLTGLLDLSNMTKEILSLVAFTAVSALLYKTSLKVLKK